MNRLLNVDDYRENARKLLPRTVFDYVDGGADDELTLGANRRAFDALALIPRSGEWVATPDLTTTVLGRKLSMPILTAPCGGMRLVHPAGDRGVARGAAQWGTVAVVASMGGHSAEEVASASAGPKWLQLYSFCDRRILEGLVARAAAAQYEALVCTLDSPVMGNRERDYRNGFTGDMRINVRSALKMGPRVITKPGWTWRYWRDGMPFEFPNAIVPGSDGVAPTMSELGNNADVPFGLTWDDLDWIRKVWQAPLVVKGILSGTDARRAVDAGVDGVIVSNHGGRQLDGSPASLIALADVVAEVGDELDVLVDGGIRRGADVVKALCLGARAVLVGRAAIWGLAVNGADGVADVLGGIRAEVVRTMQLLGRNSLSELDHGCIRPVIQDNPTLIWPRHR